MSVSHQETLWFTGTGAQVCNGGIIQNVGDLLAPSVIALFLHLGGSFSIIS